MVAKKTGFTILLDPMQYKIHFPQLEVITTRSFVKARPDVATLYFGRSSKAFTCSNTIVKRAFVP